MRCLGHAGRHSIDASRWQYALSLLHHWSGSFASERQRGQRSITFVTLLRFQREAPKIMLKQGVPWLWRVDVWDSERLRTYRQKMSKTDSPCSHSLVEKAQSTGLNWPWLKSVHVIIGWWLLCQPRLMKTTQATVPAIPPRNASFPKFFRSAWSAWQCPQSSCFQIHDLSISFNFSCSMQLSSKVSAWQMSWSSCHPTTARQRLAVNQLCGARGVSTCIYASCTSMIFNLFFLVLAKSQKVLWNWTASLNPSLKGGPMQTRHLNEPAADSASEQNFQNKQLSAVAEGPFLTSNAPSTDCGFFWRRDGAKPDLSVLSEVGPGLHARIIRSTKVGWQMVTTRWGTTWPRGSPGADSLVRAGYV